MAVPMAPPQTSTAALRATGQNIEPAMQQAQPARQQIIGTDKAAAAWAIGAIVVLAVLRRAFRGSVI